MNVRIHFLSVTTTPSVRIFTDLTFVPVILDLLEMGKPATVR